MDKSSAERVADKIGMITRRRTQVVARATMPRSATQWRPKTSREGPREAGIAPRWAPRPRDYMLLGRLHPATGSHLPMEGTAPPSAVVLNFIATHLGQGFAGGLFCQTPSEGEAPRSVARGAPRSGDRTAAGMPRLHRWGACIPLWGRIFLRKVLLRPSRSHSRRRLSRIPSCKAVVAPTWDLFIGSLHAHAKTPALPDNYRGISV